MIWKIWPTHLPINCVWIMFHGWYKTHFATYHKSTLSCFKLFRTYRDVANSQTYDHFIRVVEHSLSILALLQLQIRNRALRYCRSCTKIPGRSRASSVSCTLPVDRGGNGTWGLRLSCSAVSVPEVWRTTMTRARLLTAPQRRSCSCCQSRAGQIPVNPQMPMSRSILMRGQ